MISKTAKLAAPLCAAALMAAALPMVGIAAPSKPNVPRALTGNAGHVLGTSAQLTGVVEPNGADASYYFQWGATRGVYGNVTPTVHVGTGVPVAKIKVGQEIKGLTAGTEYFFRIVALYTGPKGPASVLGAPHHFIAKTAPLKFEVTKSLKQVVGSSFLLTGTLRGFNSQHHPIALQATQFPYTEPFTSIAAPSTTDAAGRFFFRISRFTTSTEFRVTTLDLRPLYSLPITVHAEVHVVLHVRKSSQPGLVRLYGTVTPAVPGASVLIQLNKPLKRPTRNEATSTFATQFSSVVKKGGRSFSRFSLIVNVLKTGAYRAFVKVKSGGPLISGTSATIVLHAGPTHKKAKKKKK